MPFSFSVSMWLFLYLSGELFCRSVQFIIRPLHLFPRDTLFHYLLGVAPNFWAMLSLPAGLMLVSNWVLRRRPEQALWLDPMLVYAFAFSGILAWELFQPVTKFYYFDLNDVVWTLIGGVVFWPLFRWADGRVMVFTLQEGLLKRRVLHTASTSIEAKA